MSERQQGMKGAMVGQKVKEVMPVDVESAMTVVRNVRWEKKREGGVAGV